MSANFWQSSHASHWILSQQDLAFGRQYDSFFLTSDEYQKLFIFFADFIQGVGEHLNLRQQVIATATVYFKRFYARNSLKNIDPLLMAPTCILLASKVEEFGVISTARLLQVCQTVIKTKFSYAFPNEYPYKFYHILDCEFHLVECLDCCLIVYQPYRSLLHLMQGMGGEADDKFMTLSWKVINDSLRTDVCLLYAPYQIALGCMHIACVILQKDLKLWFAELNVDLDKVLEVVRHIVYLYELWKEWNEKDDIRLLLGKMPRPRLSPVYGFF